MSKAKFIEINQKDLKTVTEDAAKKLAANGITIDVPEAIPTIALAFLKQTAKFVAENKEEINFCQLFDMGVEEDGTPYLVPGQELKLLTKSDDESEDE